MAEPCTPHCPAGDCAGCSFPPNLAHCSPSSVCPQADRCSHTVAALCDSAQAVVDGTVLRHSEGTWCPMFVDSRSASLRTRTHVLPEVA